MTKTQKQSDFYIALVHYPILNKDGRIITTSVTNFDIHDLARTARTYGVKKVFIVTPSEPQQNMVRYITEYWHEGFGAEYNPDRKEAMDIVLCAPNLSETYLTIKNLSGTYPALVATSAKRYETSISYDFLRRSRAESEQPVLLTFGTGHGLAPEFIKQCDHMLEPIEGFGDYNHLPVRSAVAIILDRLLGRTTQ